MTLAVVAALTTRCRLPIEGSMNVDSVALR
jgi:hypothetical protein